MQLHLFNFVLFSSSSSFNFAQFEYEFQLIQLFGLLLSFIEISVPLAKDSVSLLLTNGVTFATYQLDFYKSEQ